MAIHDSLVFIFDFPVFRFSNFGKTKGFDENPIFIGLLINRPSLILSKSTHE
jgi:hypothetical protein